MKFSVIIVNDGLKGNSARLCNALAVQTQRNFEVLISANTPPLPDERFRLISEITAKPLAAKNQLAQHAKGEWLFFLQSNAYPDEACLASLYACSLRFPDCAMMACTQLENTDPDMLDAAGKCYTFFGIPYCGGKDWPIDVLPAEGEVFGACSPAIVIRKHIFEAIGGFDEDFAGCLEDADLAFRMRLFGHYAMLAPEAMVLVNATPTTPHTHEHAIKNIIACNIKNMPDILFWSMLPLHLCAVIFLLLHPKHFFDRLAGLVAALNALPQLWKKRCATQKTRTVSLWPIATRLSWRPASMFWRTPLIWKKS